MPVPTGVADGDILIIAFAIGQSISLGGPDTPTIPSGWTVIQGPSRVQDTGFAVDRRLLWKVAASESAGYAFSHASNSTCAVAIAVSGGNTGATLYPREVMVVQTGMLRTLLLRRRSRSRLQQRIPMWLSSCITGVSIVGGISADRHDTHLYRTGRPRQTTSGTRLMAFSPAQGLRVTKLRRLI